MAGALVYVRLVILVVLICSGVEGETRVIRSAAPSPQYGGPDYYDRFDRYRYGRDRFDRYRYGRDRFGPDRFGPDRFGPDRFGPDRFGPDRFGPGRYGPDRYELERYRHHGPGPDEYDRVLEGDGSISISKSITISKGPGATKAESSAGSVATAEKPAVGVV